MKDFNIRADFSTQVRNSVPLSTKFRLMVQKANIFETYVNFDFVYNYFGSINPYVMYFHIRADFNTQEVRNSVPGSQNDGHFRDVLKIWDQQVKTWGTSAIVQRIILT